MMKQRQKKLDTEKCDGNVYRTFYDSYESGTQILEKLLTDGECCWLILISICVSFIYWS